MSALLHTAERAKAHYQAVAAQAANLCPDKLFHELLAERQNDIDFREYAITDVLCVDTSASLAAQQLRKQLIGLIFSGEDDLLAMSTLRAAAQAAMRELAWKRAKEIAGVRV
jgi:hypothetical protein